MNLPKPKKINAEKYVAGLSLFKQKAVKIKLSANESALGPSPRAVKEFNKVSKNVSCILILYNWFLSPKSLFKFVFLWRELTKVILYEKTDVKCSY